MAKKKAKKQVLVEKVTVTQHDASDVDQKSGAADKPHRPCSSPYTEYPVELKVGPNGMTYYVPRHILPVEWIKTGLERRLELPDTDEHAGHTLVHYLYSKDYKTLDVVSESSSSGICNEFTRALLVYIMTVRYNGLNDLRTLAMKEMEYIGSKMSICEVVGAIKQHSTKLKSPSWIHDYVRKRTNDAFAQDHTIFRSTTFLEVIENDDYDRFVMGCLMDSYDERLAYMAKAEEALSEKLEQQKLEARDTAAGGAVPEDKEKMQEDFVIPLLDEAVGMNYDREASQQCSVMTKDLCTNGRPSLEYAASFSVEEAASCCSDISVVEYPDETSQAIPHGNAPNNHPERVAAESKEERKNELARRYMRADSDTATERAVVETIDGAVAETTRFEPEYAPEPGAELNCKPQPCPRQAEHMLEERCWRECKLCRAVLHKVAVQLAQSS